MHLHEYEAILPNHPLQQLKHNVTASNSPVYPAPNPHLTSPDPRPNRLTTKNPPRPRPCSPNPSELPAQSKILRHSTTKRRRSPSPPLHAIGTMRSGESSLQNHLLAASPQIPLLHLQSGRSHRFGAVNFVVGQCIFRLFL